MTMRTLTVLVSSILGISVCAGLIASGRTEGNRQEKVREIVVETIQDLNLTDEQESKIKDIRSEFRPRVEAATKALADIVKDEMGKVRELLTPEQKEKLQALREERKEQRAEHLSEALAHCREMELTDAEFAKIEEIRKETRPKIEKAIEAFRGIRPKNRRRPGRKV
jgi:hypothetical protein